MPSQPERGETGGEGDRHKEASRQAANKRQKTAKDRVERERESWRPRARERERDGEKDAQR